MHAQSTIQRVRSFASFKSQDEGEPETQHERYFKSVLLPAYKTIFESLEGRKPTDKDQESGLKESTKPFYKALKSAFGKGKFPEEALERFATLLDRQEGALTISRTQLRFGNRPLSFELFYRFLGFLSMADLAVLRRVCKYLAYYVSDKTVLKVNVYGSIREITFGDVVNYMRPYQQMGIHGSSSTHRLSMYQGIRLPKKLEKNYTTSQLGEGFYLTQGKGGSKDDYARSVAKESVEKYGGERYLYRIFMRDLDTLKSTKVPKEDWADMEKDKEPESLKPYIKNYDYLTAPIVKVEHVPQIKINPDSLDKVIALPPVNSQDKVNEEDILEWLQSLVDSYKL